jgi:hypothetical protein
MTSTSSSRVLPVSTSSKPNFAASNTFRPPRQSFPSSSKSPFTASPNAPTANSSTPPSSGVVISYSRVTQPSGLSRTEMKVKFDGSLEDKILLDDGIGKCKINGEMAAGDRVQMNVTSDGEEWSKAGPVKATTIKKKRKLFTVDHLVCELGLRKILKQFKTFSPRGESFESRDLHDLMGMYKRWGYELWPKLSVNVLAKRIGIMGSQGRMKVLLEEIRANLGENIDWENFKLDLDNEETNEINKGNDNWIENENSGSNKENDEGAGEQADEGERAEDEGGENYF